MYKMIRWLLSLWEAFSVKVIMFLEQASTLTGTLVVASWRVDFPMFRAFHRKSYRRERERGLCYPPLTKNMLCTVSVLLRKKWITLESRAVFCSSNKSILSLEWRYFQRNHCYQSERLDGWYSKGWISPCRVHNFSKHHRLS